MHRTKPFTIDPAAARAWLHQPSGTTGVTRAEILGVDDELTGPAADVFLATIDDVLTAQPDGLHHRGDIAGVQLWLIPDGDILDQGVLITVDLANGIRLASRHQDITDFADRDQRGIPAVLSALDHIAAQVCQLMAAYEAAHPHDRAEPEASR